MVIRFLWGAGNFLQRWSTETHSIITQLRAVSYFYKLSSIGQYFCFGGGCVYASNFGLETDKLFKCPSRSVSVHAANQQISLFKSKDHNFLLHLFRSVTPKYSSLFFHVAQQLPPGGPGHHYFTDRTQIHTR